MGDYDFLSYEPPTPLKIRSRAENQALLEIRAADGEILLSIRLDEPSYVNVDRLGEAAQTFVDEVLVRLKPAWEAAT